MSFVRYKKRGKVWYVYDVFPFWDKEIKKYRQKSTYLGVAQEKDGPYKKLDKVQKKNIFTTEKSIVDFGDSYVIQEVIKNMGLDVIIQDSVGHTDSLMALLCYQMTEGMAMVHCLDWVDGNIASILFPNAQLQSQEISRLLNHLGNQSVQQKFFKAYLSHFFQETHGVLIDSTAMPSSINASINACGYSSAGLMQNVGCLMLVDKKSQLPLYFRAISGDLADVSTLKITLAEIKLLGLKIEEAILDAGYFCEENVKYLCEQKINFVSRMPKSRKIFKELVQQTGKLETREHAVAYGKRAVFIKSQKIELYGHPLWAHVILDPHKKAKDTQQLLFDSFEGDKSTEDVNDAINFCGFFILVSRESIASEEVLPTYYTRQSIEQVFGIAKSKASLLPLRVHSEQSINGYLFLVFLSLILFVTMRQKLKKQWTVEQALLILRTLKAKIFDTQILIQENTKKVKDITKLLDVIMPSEMRSKAEKNTS